MELIVKIFSNIMDISLDLEDNSLSGSWKISLTLSFDKEFDSAALDKAREEYHRCEQIKMLTH